MDCYGNSAMRITRQGLCTIALLTGVLWSCILVEHRTVTHARAEADRALSEIRALQVRKHIVPVTSPSEPRAPRSDLG